jgi:hypothetical protein
MYTQSEIRERRVHPVRTARWQSKIHAGRERDTRSEFAREIENAVPPAGGQRRSLPRCETVSPRRHDDHARRRWRWPI